ncbi:MAG: hypothetical protein SOW01_05935 [Mediterranea sp.]|nr:hypothetical protein [Mediterranea sp.]
MKRLFTLGMLIGFITMSYGQKLAIYNVAATAEEKKNRLIRSPFREKSLFLSKFS